MSHNSFGFILMVAEFDNGFSSWYFAAVTAAKFSIALTYLRCEKDQSVSGSCNSCLEHGHAPHTVTELVPLCHLLKPKTLVSIRTDLQVGSRVSSGSIVSDYGLGKRGSIPGGGRGFFL
jgi:hypothetical protein